MSWVDYCNKYGMGYALTDGSVGVYFNDSTTMVLAPDKQYVYYSSALAYHGSIDFLPAMSIMFLHVDRAPFMCAKVIAFRTTPMTSRARFISSNTLNDT